MADRSVIITNLIEEIHHLNYSYKVYPDMQSTGICKVGLGLGTFSYSAGTLWSLKRTYYIYIIYSIDYNNN